MSKYLLSSVSRALKVVDFIALNPNLGLTEISRKMGINKATCNKILYTLEDGGWVFKSKSAKYQLSLRFLYYASQIDPQYGYKEELEPYLRELVNKYNESAHCGVLINSDKLIVVAKESPNREFYMTSRVGHELPAYATAMGKSLLAFSQNEDIISKLKNLEYNRYTKNTVSSFELLKNQLKEITKKGYSEDNEEVEDGLTCYGVPILDHNSKPIMAISISGPTVRMHEKKEAIISSLKKISKKLENYLSNNSD